MVLGLDLPPTPESAALDERFVPERIAKSVESLLAGLVPDAALLVLDDVHYMDEASVELIGQIARRHRKPTLAPAPRTPRERGRLRAASRRRGPRAAARGPRGGRGAASGSAADRERAALGSCSGRRRCPLVGQSALRHGDDRGVGARCRSRCIARFGRSDDGRADRRARERRPRPAETGVGARHAVRAVEFRHGRRARRGSSRSRSRAARPFSRCRWRRGCPVPARAATRRRLSRPSVSSPARASPPSRRGVRASG